MRLIKIVFMLLTVTACSSTVNVDYDKDFDFRLIKTYFVVAQPVRVSTDTRINSPFMQQRVVQAIESNLALKGLKKFNQQSNVKVKYFLDIKREIESQDSGMSIGFGTSRANSAIAFGYSIPTAETSNYDNLVITIDILSVKTNKLLWRGSLGYRLVDGSRPETYNKLISELVTEILKLFPPQ